MNTAIFAYHIIIDHYYHVCVHGREVNVKGGGTVSVNTVHLMIYKYK